MMISNSGNILQKESGHDIIFNKQSGRTIHDRRKKSPESYDSAALSDIEGVCLNRGRA